jgi:hypothetical protein
MCFEFVNLDGFALPEHQTRVGGGKQIDGF